jgi:DNA segregation ATPase FtsK/SpoIIIE, S-DNA-T family
VSRKAKSTNFYLNHNTNKIIFWLLFLFFGLVTIIAETNSTFGLYLYQGCTYLFGTYYKFIFGPMAIMFSVFLFKEEDMKFDLYRFFGTIFYFTSLVTMIGYFKSDYQALFNLFPKLEAGLWKNTTFLLAFGIFVFSLVILFKFSPKHVVKTVAKTVPKASELANNFKSDAKKVWHDDEEEEAPTKKSKKVEKARDEYDDMLEELRREKEALAKEKQSKNSGTLEKLGVKPQKESIVKHIPILDKAKGVFQEKKEDKVIAQPKFNNWKFPSLDLLTDRKTTVPVDQNEIRRKEIEIQEKLLQFKIEVDMEGCKVGPTVIQYRLKPRDGVKLQKIENLKKDLTLALEAKSIRIQAPIPGLGVVGIEVPNDQRQAVGLKELLASKEFQNPKIEIPMAVGKDVSGNLIIGDLARMPHLLVAGQTASGKSVGVNGFLISLLYRFTPSELKMILVDPKRVELSVYNGIPHLLTPVITNPDKALNALKWCVAEMLRRYDLATKVGARNLKEYNERVDKDKKFNYIIIVLDELADLMMSGNKKEVEGSIVRVAQMGRAVGMHIIVATQRPSVDVITGLIKANVPSRIAFTVASQIDSRTIIDKAWAEDLLGRWDMLYSPTWAVEDLRVQWVLVETDEVEAVVNQLKLTVDPDMLNNLYDDEIVNGKSGMTGGAMEGYEGDQDEDPAIIEKAIQVVKESRKGSTSLIQRKLGLGYARAAKVLDILEELWVVGPANGSKPREVYVD